MKNVRWTVYDGKKHVSSGMIAAESDKDALGQIMLEQDGKLAPDKSYSFTAGKLSTSSYGDELKRSARVTTHGMDEKVPIPDGEYIFQPTIGDRKAAKKMLGVPLATKEWVNKTIGDVLRENSDVLKDIIGRTPVDTGWGRNAKDLAKLRREQRAGRRTFTADQAAEIVKSQTGRDVECSGKRVWTQNEVDRLVGQVRCPASPVGPSGHHNYQSIPGSKGVPGCKGLGYERCHKCKNKRVKREWPKEMDPLPIQQPITKARQRTKGTVTPSLADAIVGHALENGKKGDIIEVALYPGVGDGCIRKLRCGSPTSIGEPLRVGADGRVYGAARGDPIPYPPYPPILNEKVYGDIAREVRPTDENIYFTAQRGVSVDQVEVSYIHDQVTFSLKDSHD